MLANYHTHTVRCNHATGTEREYIEEAIKHGFKILGFSDHVPQPYPEGLSSRIRMKMEDIGEYRQTLLNLREEYKDKIKILIGFEVEYTVQYFPKLIEALRENSIDYIIQGQHYAPDEFNGFYAGMPTTSEQDLRDYVDLTIQGMQTGLFTYLAHPDLINFHGDDAVYRKYMQKIVESALQLDIPLEVNMLGFVEKRNYPCDRFFSMASEMGAKFIIGCDSHKPTALRQPEEIPGFLEFMERNGITKNLIQENEVTIRKIKQ
jgi:histidinol-phosphatase (PHP family)